MRSPCPFSPNITPIPGNRKSYLPLPPLARQHSDINRPLTLSSRWLVSNWLWINDALMKYYPVFTCLLMWAPFTGKFSAKKCWLSVVFVSASRAVVREHITRASFLLQENNFCNIFHKLYTEIMILTLQMIPFFPFFPNEHVLLAMRTSDYPGRWFLSKQAFLFWWIERVSF